MHVSAMKELLYSTDTYMYFPLEHTKASVTCWAQSEGEDVMEMNYHNNL